MPTQSENTVLNPSEALSNIPTQLTNNIRGVTYGLTYDSQSVDRPPSSITPNGLTFPPIPTYGGSNGSGLSNGYASALNGITDFTAYNDYIHYAPITGGGLGNIGTALGGAGINNVSTGGSPRFNVYDSLKRATFRFEIYSRQYRT